MAVYTEIFRATDWDREHANGNYDRELFPGNQYEPRIVTLEGVEYRTQKSTMDLVAAGKARFEVKPRLGKYMGDPDEIAYLVEHEGAVLADRERNWSDDSDWYALYWTGSEIASDTYRTTRGGGTDRNYVTIDPTPEVLAAVRDYQTAMNFRSIRSQEYEDWRDAAIEAALPTPGARVKVVRGRKVPKGTEGKVFWRGNSGWGDSVGFKTDAGEKHFTAERNVEVLDVELPALETFRDTDAEVAVQARTLAERTWTDGGARLGVRVLA